MGGSTHATQASSDGWRRMMATSRRCTSNQHQPTENETCRIGCVSENIEYKTWNLNSARRQFTALCVCVCLIQSACLLTTTTLACNYSEAGGLRLISFRRSRKKNIVYFRFGCCSRNFDENKYLNLKFCHRNNEIKMRNDEELWVLGMRHAEISILENYFSKWWCATYINIYIWPTNG